MLEPKTMKDPKTTPTFSVVAITPEARKKLKALSLRLRRSMGETACCLIDQEYQAQGLHRKGPR